MVIDLEIYKELITDELVNIKLPSIDKARKLIKRLTNDKKFIAIIKPEGDEAEILQKEIEKRLHKNLFLNGRMYDENGNLMFE